MRAKDWKCCYVCKIAEMKIASGSKMSEIITGAFKGEKQFSTIMSPLWLIGCYYFSLAGFTM